jgi:hypothetical protein
MMIGSRAGGGHGPGGSPRGGVTTPKGGTLGLFRWFSTKSECAQLRIELDQLKRAFAQVQQEWDTTVDRVAKTLRRIRRAEQAQELVIEDENAKLSEPSALTTVPTPPDRMTRIKQQLAARKGGE